MATLQAMRQAFKMAVTRPGFDSALKNTELLSIGGGKILCEMKVEEQHQNGFGTLHGGMTATLIDMISTFGLATAGENKMGVSVDLNVSYMNAAKVGETLVIESETLKVGRTLAFLNVTLKRKSDGKLVAVGRHTKHVG